MARRIVSARDQVEMLSPWRTAAEDPTPPSIHDIMPGRFSDGNGRWDYRHQETSGDSYLRHEYGIHPVTSPASHSYVDHRGKTHTVHYDPALTGGQLPRPGKWGHEWENPDAVRNKLTDLNPPPGMLWRGMSREEYERSRDRGYFESEGGHNFDSQQGLTFFSTKPEQAENYATWFAPQAHEPTFTHPGYVVGIPDRPDAPRGAIPGQTEIGSTEVGLPGRIPFSEATHHYVGQVSTLRPGMQGVSEGWRGWEESGGAHPSSTIMWSRVHPGHHTASRRLAERADDLRWERDSSGNWILITRNPDGNPVAVRTERAPSVRTSRRTAMPLPEQAHDTDPGQDWADAPRLTSRTFNGPWFHASPHELAEGTVIRPRGGESPYGDKYDTTGTTGRQDWVWMETEPGGIHHWAQQGQAPNIYLVEPHDGPYPWNNTGMEGWVANGATVVNKISDNGRLPKGFIPQWVAEQRAKNAHRTAADGGDYDNWEGDGQQRKQQPGPAGACAGQLD